MGTFQLSDCPVGPLVDRIVAATRSEINDQCRRVAGAFASARRRQRRAALATVLGLALITPSEAIASVMNGDFSAGFDGWTGEVTDIFFTTTLVDPPPGAFSGNFDASSNEAVLSTSTLVDDIFSVFLFQGIALAPVGPGTGLVISYDFDGVLSDPFIGGALFAQLGNLSLPLADTTDFDVTAAAGTMKELLFGVEDFDDIPDTLTIDNVVIRTVAVPEPASLPLVGGGIALVVAFGRRYRPRKSRSVSALGMGDADAQERAFAR